MRALVQRVTDAQVTVDGTVVGRIGQGLCVFLGVKQDDTLTRAEKLANKVVKLRVFNDEAGKMNSSLSDVKGELLIVSQFTLYGDTRRGNRPSYSQAAGADLARELYESFVQCCKGLCPLVATGIFQAHMQVYLRNDGPVTVMCDCDE